MLNCVVETITRDYNSLSLYRNRDCESWRLQGSFQGEGELDRDLGGQVKQNSAGGRRQVAFQERVQSEQESWGKAWSVQGQGRGCVPETLEEELMLSLPAGARASQLEWQLERSGLGWELGKPWKVFLQRNVMKERTLPTPTTLQYFPVS